MAHSYGLQVFLASYPEPVQLRDCPWMPVLYATAPAVDPLLRCLELAANRSMDHSPATAILHGHSTEQVSSPGDPFFYRPVTQARDRLILAAAQYAFQ